MSRHFSARLFNVCRVYQRTSGERLHHGMLPVLDLDPMLRPTSLIKPIAMPAHQALQAHLARGDEQVRPDFPLFEIASEDPIRRASSRARLALRIESGSFRKSSPSIASMSKAQSGTSSLCLPECSALKAGSHQRPK
jgi:hypothetical protein